MSHQTLTPPSDLGPLVERLAAAGRKLAELPLPHRIQLVDASIRCVHRTARDWVDLACAAKRIPDGSAARAEEVTAGPVAVLRYLQLLRASLRDIQRFGVPRLPGKPKRVDGQWQVPIFPTRQIFDRLLFQPIKVSCWLEPGVEELFGSHLEQINGETTGRAPSVCLVLGAGNVSSIPATDALTKILQDGETVLLKMNPVNDYLGPVFTKALQPLIEAGFLCIVYGDGALGQAAISNRQVDKVHITGSNRTHDLIVWGAEETERRRAEGRPVIDKAITSELGNVSPWIIVPHDYTKRELAFQAENVAASITNNASFNCVATKMLITASTWPQREEFLQLLGVVLKRTVERFAYYPGANTRFVEFSGASAPVNHDGTLPWTIRRGVTVDSAPELFSTESFVCVCGETSIHEASPTKFLRDAVEFANEHVWGTLAATMTVPNGFRRKHAAEFNQALARLRYGSIGINQWPALVFALMSPPWGAYPVTRLADVQSGFGSVHNTYLLDRPQKSILSSATTISPKPMWFSTHRRSEALAWKLCDLYADPRAARLPALLLDAVMG